jgi:integrase
MIQLQKHTGMRPGEVCIMRTADLDTTGEVWSYTPHRHKTEHHGKQRVIYLGPRAREVLRPWLRTDLTAYLFQPREVMEQSLARRRTRPKASGSRQAGARRRAPGDHYTAQSYGRAIDQGCDRAFPHPTLSRSRPQDLSPEQRAELAAWRREHRWHPHQLRHNAATYLRKSFGLDIARVVLGHSSPAVTETYAEIDHERARAVMERVG